MRSEGRATQVKPRAATSPMIEPAIGQNENNTELSTVIFFGAGASCSEGAPSQADLFRRYFEQVRHSDPYSHDHEMQRELATFFATFFGIDVDSDDLSKANFPTFEEALGVLELAISRGESFVGLGDSEFLDGGGHIRRMRNYLILLIAATLQFTLERAKGTHRRLVESLSVGGVLNDVAFISFNYDILIDNALLKLYPSFDLDYGLEFTNFRRQDDWHRPNPHRAVSLYKVHGSLNWLYCPSCKSLTLTPKEKAICKLIFDPGSCVCANCRTVAAPIVIPPSYFKVLSNYHLQTVWHQAEQCVARSAKWIFCGYSFPDADIHVKYLLKRTQLLSSLVRHVYVFNNHDGKDRNVAKQEEDRYRRFLGPNVVMDFRQEGFEEFAANPLRLSEGRVCAKNHQRLARTAVGAG